MMIQEDIQKATTGKKVAQAARNSGDFPRAIELIENAIKTLEPHATRLNPTTAGTVSADGLKLAEALTDVYGSAGGIYRSAREYARSVERYDQGVRIEQNPLFKFVNSYNLVQRLVARVLWKPNEWIVPGCVIGDETFPACLDRARSVVDQQTRAPRAGDAWAWADLGMLDVLRGQTGEMAWDRVTELSSKAKQTFVFASTETVLTDLYERLVSVPSADPASSKLAPVVGQIEAARETLATERRLLEEDLRRGRARS
jgi:tetratricopeptide (TPR) repeat protein